MCNSASDMQRHPEKWVVQQPPDGSSTDMPSISLPRIVEVFSLQDCLRVSHVECCSCLEIWRSNVFNTGTPLIYGS